MAHQFNVVSSPAELSPYRLRLCRLIMNGYSSAEIAVQLHTTRGAVDEAIRRIMLATGTRNRAHLVAWSLGVRSVDNPTLPVSNSRDLLI